MKLKFFLNIQSRKKSHVYVFILEEKKSKEEEDQSAFSQLSLFVLVIFASLKAWLVS